MPNRLSPCLAFAVVTRQFRGVPAMRMTRGDLDNSIARVTTTSLVLILSLPNVINLPQGVN